MHSVDKCDLVKTHTARCSGATNMYLAGILTIAIMKITGHKTEKGVYEIHQDYGRADRHGVDESSVFQREAAAIDRIFAKCKLLYTFVTSVKFTTVTKCGIMNFYNRENKIAVPHFVKKGTQTVRYAIADIFLCFWFCYFESNRSLCREGAASERQGAAKI